MSATSHSSTKSLAKIAFIVSAALLLMAAIPGFFLPSGMDNPEPIGKFLNGRLPSTTPAITTASGWEVEPAFPNIRFNDPTTFVADPHSNRLYVGSRDGKIYSFENNPNTNQKDLVLDLSNKVAVVWDGGFLGMALHPDFGVPGAPNRNHFYVWYSARSYPGAPYYNSWVDDPIFFNTYLRLSRFTIPDGSTQADPNSELVMINVRLYGGTHRGGGMSFGKDGLLYVTIGEQWRYITAQNIDTTMEGGIIRLDVDKNAARSHPPRRSFPLPGGPPEQVSGVGYWIPNDNPWQDPNGSIFEEYYSIGHRAPHRLTVDQLTGRIWVGEVGSSRREEINVIEKGGNYGWPYREGLIGGPYGALPGQVLGQVKDPVVDFTRDETNALIGGYVYRGSQLPMLYGKYLCGGYAQNRIWALSYDEGSGTATKEYLCQFSPGSLATFGQDNSGEVYLCGLGSNVNLYKLKAQGVSTQAPRLLSQTGAFEDLSSLRPAQGVIPYDVNEPFWSDGVEKYRFLSIPNDGQHNTSDEKIAFSENGTWGFPKGSVFIKHMELPMDHSNPANRRRIETRFMVHGDDGRYYGLTYRWRSDGNDADLVESAQDETFTVQTNEGPRQQTWHYPSQSECMVCHNDNAGSVLGLNTRQLNGDETYPQTGRTANQLATLDQLNMFDQAIDHAQIPGFLTLANKYDESASLEKRARSYIDVNCAYCHRPGSGNRAVFDARFTTPLADQNLIWGQVSNNLGVAGARVVVPQSLEKSVLYQRILAVHNSVAMPPLAKDLVDEDGAQVIADWINSLDASNPPPVDCGVNEISAANWQLISVDSEETQGENGQAINAFDGNPNTFWHSQWYPSNQPLPHELQIDLGQTYKVAGIQYLPRQDAGINGTVGQYEVYVSDIPGDWGTPVAAGSFANNKSEKTLTFTSKSGRYLRFRALSEVNGGPWTTVAELGVLASECLKTDQLITFDPIPDQTTDAGPITLSASSNSGLPVSFEWIEGPAAISGNVLTLTGETGTVRVEARQNGNDYYNAAAPVRRSFEVIAPVNTTPILTLISPAEGTTVSAPDITVQYQSSGNPGSFGAEAVQFLLNGTPTGTQNALSGTYLLEGLAPGTYALEVRWVDDNDFPLDLEGANSTSSFTVVKQDQSIAFDPIPDQSIETPQWVLTATSSSGLPVRFELISGPASLEDNVLTFDGTEGTLSIQATQAGNTYFNPAIPVQRTFRITASPPPTDCDTAFLDKNGWTLLYADSEETQGEDGAATHVFDGNPNSIWHTQWYPNNIPGPHEIQIDLGSSRQVVGFSYLPRQVGVNGSIAAYAFFVSENPDSWGEPVIEGTFAAGQQEKIVDFTGKTGRYIRLVALSEVNGGPWTTVAELGVKATDCQQGPPPMETQSITFAPIPDKLTTDAPITLSASATSGLPVSFALIGGPATLSGNMLTLSGNEGTVVMEARQGGNAQYEAAAPVRRSFNVSKPVQDVPPTLTLLSPENNGSYPSPDLTVNFQVSGTWAAMGVSGVALDLAGPTPASQTLAINVQTTTFRGLLPGTYTLNGRLIDGAGQALPHPEAQVEINFLLEKATQVITFNPIPDKYVSDQPFALNPVASSGLPVAIRIISGPAALAGNTLLLEGVPGTVTVEAVQEGDATYLAASPVSRSFEVLDQPDPQDCTTEWMDPSSWTLLGVDSEEYQGENGAATQAFDGNPNSIWHSQWYPSNDPMPHYIQIDLGTVTQVAGFSYLPRQVGVNGTIAGYAFYVSEAPDAWGEPVVEGTFGAGQDLKTVNFDPVQGRYIQLIALSEINGGPWTTVAELGILASDCQSTPSKLAQSIVFSPIADKNVNDPDFDLAATASSGLPVSFEVISGPATVLGNTLSLTGEIGTVRINATQSGNSEYAAATPVEQRFDVLGEPLPASITLLSPGANSAVPATGFSLTWETGGTPETSGAEQIRLTMEPAGISQTLPLSSTTHTFTLLPLGIQTLTAALIDPNGQALPHPEATDVLQVNVVRETQTIAFEEVPDQSPDSGPIVLNASASSGLPVTLQVVSGPAVVEGTLLTLSGETGTVLLRATQAGNAYFAPAPTAEQTFEVSEEPLVGDCDTIRVNPSAWQLVYVDSEEYQGEDGLATNAFDGDPNTLWHTQWYPVNKPMPHEIQIDMGITYEVSGFTYLPRQVGKNGDIGSYRFYVSQDGQNWGSPLASGTFVSNRLEKTVRFAATAGRYIRWEILSEASGGPWTSAAELGVLALDCQASPARLTGQTAFAAASESLEETSLVQPAIYIYPNPFKDLITLSGEVPKPGEVLYISIANSMGQVILTRSLTLEANTFKLSLATPNLAAGYYIVQCRWGESLKTYRMLKTSGE